MGRPALSQIQEARSERFWNKVEFTLTGCWLWTGGITSKGYGNFGPQLGVNIRAHRFAFSDFYGVELPEDIKILHTCDVRRCVNPEHHWVGSSKDNTQDMLSKGRDRGSIYRRTA